MHDRLDQRDARSADGGRVRSARDHSSYPAGMPSPSTPPVRLSELVASLSLATDLGLGLPQEHVLRQTVIALAAGSGLAEHNSPGEATLQVLRGRVRLTAAGESTEAEAGDLLVIPPDRHSLDATDDSAVLLTVALRRA